MMDFVIVPKFIRKLLMEVEIICLLRFFSTKFFHCQCSAWGFLDVQSNFKSIDNECKKCCTKMILWIEWEMLEIVLGVIYC
jgi:hypothetical protein